MIQDKILTGCAPAHAHPRTQLFVLIACEESQAETNAFRALGHAAFSCDIQRVKPPRKAEWHICGDATPLLRGQTKFTTQDGQLHDIPGWDLIIAHPPCTYLCRVSSVQLVRHIDGRTFVDEERYLKMQAAIAFFYECLNACAPFVAVENPQPMARCQLPPPSFFACPSWYGVRYTKKTLYWVRNLPPLVAAIDFPNPKEFVRASRGKYRSRTFPELARAIAEQWGSYIISEINKSK